MTTIFKQSISEEIWDMKYRLKSANNGPREETIDDTWRRIAWALSEPEKDRDYWSGRFFNAMKDFKFLPAGRIIAGAGTGRDVTLFNCFVMGTIPDSMDGIFSMLREAALTMQQGGGIGYDFSTLRPKGALVKGVAADASGPLTFMDVWDAMCRTVMSAGSRRGAMMATMRCDHPDILDFVNAKRDAARLRMFNLSVLVTDAFMDAVRIGDEWELRFGGQSYGSYDARFLWDQIMKATYDCAEPGVIFIDRINQMNPLRNIETISSTNPCAEQPLPPYGACLLGSINLAALVENPFTAREGIDLDVLEDLVGVAVRMMDNVVDVSKFPLEAQATEAKLKRRIGLGITGVADALAMCGLRYGSKRAAERLSSWAEWVESCAIDASESLAEEKGAFSLYDSGLMDFKPRRNSHLTSIAPTGTISLLANNVSSGIEPIFAKQYTRKVLQPDGSKTEQVVEDYAVREWRKLKGNEPLPHYFVTTADLTWQDHVRMQAACQPFVDSAISKTINLPKDIPFEDFKGVYTAAYEQGCKGCTTYRPNEITGSVLSTDEPEIADPDAVDQRDSEMMEQNEKAWAKLREEAESYTLDEQKLIDALRQEMPPADAVPDRPEVLDGATYKVKWPNAAHAFYVTVNNLSDDHGTRPFEVFVSTKNTQHQSWITALTRMISAVFRRGGDVGFVVEELRAIVDANDTAYKNGRFVPSIQAMIGDVLKRHISETCGDHDVFPWDGVVDVEPPSSINSDPPPFWETSMAVPAIGDVAEARRMQTCKVCGSAMLKAESGCVTCMSCGDSRCG